MRNLIVLISLMSTSFAYINAYAGQTFEKRYYNTIKSIIWAADKAQVPRELVLAVCWGESSFRTTGVTHVDGETPSYGVCQVKLETAQFIDKFYRLKHKVTPERLNSTMINAFYAAKYLKYQLNRYKQDWKLAVDAYNKGTALGHKTKYVRKVTKNREHIKKQVPAAKQEEEKDHTNEENMSNGNA